MKCVTHVFSRNKVGRVMIRLSNVSSLVGSESSSCDNQNNISSKPLSDDVFRFRHGKRWCGAKEAVAVNLQQDRATIRLR